MVATTALPGALLLAPIAAARAPGQEAAAAEALVRQLNALDPADGARYVPLSERSRGSTVLAGAGPALGVTLQREGQ